MAGMVPTLLSLWLSSFLVEPPRLDPPTPPNPVWRILLEFCPRTSDPDYTIGPQTEGFWCPFGFQTKVQNPKPVP